MVDGTTAKFLHRGLSRATTGWPGCQGEAPDAELLAVLDQSLGSTRDSLMNKPAAGLALLGLQGFSRVGWTSLPTTSNFSSLRREHPSLDVGRVVACHALGEGELLCLPIVVSFFKRRPSWFIGWLNKALAPVPSRSGLVGRYLKPQFRARHECSGFLTASDHV